MQNDMNLFFDFIEIAAGLYMVFIAINMKRTGSIASNGMISKSIDLNRAPDPMGYIKVMFPLDLAAGILLALCGIASRVGDKLGIYQQVTVVTMIVAVVVILGLGFISIKMQKKYLQQ